MRGSSSPSSVRVTPATVIYSDWAVPTSFEQSEYPEDGESAFDSDYGGLMADEVAPELLDGAYSPIITCAALQGLYSHRHAVVRWLKRELEPLVRHPAGGHESVLAWNLRVVARWRLLETAFGVELGWTHHDASAAPVRGTPYSFTPTVLGCYYLQSAAVLSELFGCPSCEGGGVSVCSSNLTVHLTRSMPWMQRYDTGSAFPDCSSFSEEQMAAWSLAVSFVGFGLLGRALSSETVEQWAHALLRRWTPEVQRILGAEVPRRRALPPATR